MAERFEFIFYWISKKSFFRVAQRTFITLMPLLLIGVMAQTLMTAFIGYDSWLYNISYAYQTMSSICLIVCGLRASI